MISPERYAAASAQIAAACARSGIITSAWASRREIGSLDRCACHIPVRVAWLSTLENAICVPF